MAFVRCGVHGKGAEVVTVSVPILLVDTWIASTKGPLETAYY